MISRKLTKRILRNHRDVSLERLRDTLSVLGTHSELVRSILLEADHIVERNLAERTNLLPFLLFGVVFFYHVVGNRSAAILLINKTKSIIM